MAAEYRKALADLRRFQDSVAFKATLSVLESFAENAKESMVSCHESEFAGLQGEARAARKLIRDLTSPVRQQGE